LLLPLRSARAAFRRSASLALAGRVPPTIRPRQRNCAAAAARLGYAIYKELFTNHENNSDRLNTTLIV
jgi:hypothetical protein